MARLGENDQVLSTSRFLSAADNSTGTPRLKFNSDVAVDGAQALLVNISYPGFAAYSRRLDVQPLIFVDALLSKAAEPLSPVKTGTFALRSGVAVQGAQLAVTDSLTLTIPAEILPAATLAGKSASFDPNNPAQAIYFPGNYAGVKGELLIATAFDFVQLTAADGSELNLLAGEQLVWISRALPQGSCASLIAAGDSNSQQAGWQVPIYGFDKSKGLWELAGEGTVYDQSGAAVNTLNCPASLVIEGAVSAATLNNHWLSLSLAQSLVQPVPYCAAVQVKNSQGDKLAGIHGLISGQNTGQLSSSYFTTDAEGLAHIEISAAGLTESIPAQLSFVNDGVVSEKVILTPNCANPEPQTVVLNRPRLCQIQGRVTDAGSEPLINYPVVAQATNNGTAVGLFDFAITDNQGIYWLNVACKESFALKFTRFFELEVVVSGIAVNGKVDGEEQKDDGQTASVNGTKITTVTTGISSAVYSTSTAEITINLLSSHGNFPLTANLQVVNARNEVVATIKAVAQDSTNLGGTSANWIYGAGQLVQKADLGDGKELTVKGSLTDAKGKITQIGLSVPIAVTVK